MNRLVIVMLIAAGLMAAEAPRIVIMPFSASGMSKDDARAVSVLIRSAVKSRSVFSLYPESAMNAECSAQELSSCNNVIGMSIGKRLSAAYVMYGTLSKQTDGYELACSLIDMRAAGRERSMRLDFSSMDDLSDIIDVVLNAVLPRTPSAGTQTSLNTAEEKQGATVLPDKNFTLIDLGKKEAKASPAKKEASPPERREDGHGVGFTIGVEIPVSYSFSDFTGVQAGGIVPGVRVTSGIIFNDAVSIDLSVGASLCNYILSNEVKGPLYLTGSLIAKLYPLRNFYIGGGIQFDYMIGYGVFRSNASGIVTRDLTLSYSPGMRPDALCAVACAGYEIKLSENLFLPVGVQLKYAFGLFSSGAARSMFDIGGSIGLLVRIW